MRPILGRLGVWVRVYSSDRLDVEVPTEPYTSKILSLQDCKILDYRASGLRALSTKQVLTL